ncbi:MAG TPA: methylmalonyl-CoA mutase subunit beta [Flavobacterium sp.]|nr:methylmalonyl-CoA mutase subunit beta [Flavobacterium sp.]
MMSDKLFQEFESVSSKQWKQQIQFELKGADYNETLIWETPEGIKVKPFYHNDEFENKVSVNTRVSDFKILQRIYVFDVEKSSKRAKETISRGAESVYFTVEKPETDLSVLFNKLPKEVTYYVKTLFLSEEFSLKVNEFAKANKLQIKLLLDPIGQLTQDGNWFSNLDTDFSVLNNLNTKVEIPFLSIDSGLYQNAGANMVQQLAYTLAHINEYFNRIQLTTDNSQLTVEVSVGSNYFFEIAKLRALRMLFDALKKEYNYDFDCHIIAQPTKRNKTLYDYNVNMLRTTTECMSAVLGGSDAVSNLAYDVLFHKENEFGDRISRNQLLVLKHESYFDKVDNPADGAYYIETLTEQLAEKALELFKDIEKNGGLITQLIEGTIQRKISESAEKEQKMFDEGKEILLGTNKYPNKEDRMKHDLELFPFVKQNPRKTLITPIIKKRLAEKLEQERVEKE